MGLPGIEEMKSLKDLLFHQLEDVYGEEKRPVNAITEIQEAAHNNELKTRSGSISVRPRATSIGWLKVSRARPGALAGDLPGHAWADSGRSGYDQREGV